VRETAEVAAARAEAIRCRARLVGTAEQLQQRLSPKRLTRDAWDGAKDKGADLAENAVDAVRARPLAATGVVAAISLFLAREPLMDLAGKIAHGFGAKRATKKRPKTSRRTKKDTETVE
jgi:ElaB/YqjD/DUF883 family membrane-anchored ribosome-binding protein